MSGPRFVVVGIGADGWTGLTDHARGQLSSATTIIGSRRQLALLPSLGATTVPWRSPMSEHLTELIADNSTITTHVLASGDPLLHGVAVSLIRGVGPENVVVIPAVSSVSLAAARLRWDLARTRVASVVNRPVSSLLGQLSDGVDLLVLARDRATTMEIARLLCDNGFGWSAMSALSDLNGPDEQRLDGLARDWTDRPSPVPAVVAVSCVGPTRSIAPGLPDSDYDSDGQLSKGSVRALAVSALRPAPRQLLWDVGGGSGSVSIEYLRMDNTCRAIVFEADETRRTRIEANARRHGVADRLDVRGHAPTALGAAPDPDAVFIGGGLTVPGVFDTCWAALTPGGTFVAHAVTAESEALLVELSAHHGGVLQRIQTHTLSPLGSMTAWRPALPVTQWVVTSPTDRKPCQVDRRL